MPFISLSKPLVQFKSDRKFSSTYLLSHIEATPLPGGTGFLPLKGCMGHANVRKFNENPQKKVEYFCRLLK